MTLVQFENFKFDRAQTAELRNQLCIEPLVGDLVTTLIEKNKDRMNDE
jgi:hypothetical protein